MSASKIEVMLDPIIDNLDKLKSAMSCLPTCKMQNALLKNRL